MESVEYRKVQAVANTKSLSVVIPRKLAKNLGLEKGSIVKIRQEGTCIVLERI